MRIRFSNISITEYYDITVTPGGWPDENNKGKYTDMSCYLEVHTCEWPKPGDVNYDERFDGINNIGEFDCTGCTTFEDIDNLTKPFFDDLLINGYVDLSTDEQCAKYKIILW